MGLRNTFYFFFSREGFYFHFFFAVPCNRVEATSCNFYVGRRVNSVLRIKCIRLDIYDDADDDD